MGEFASVGWMWLCLRCERGVPGARASKETNRIEQRRLLFRSARCSLRERRVRGPARRPTPASSYLAARTPAHASTLPKATTLTSPTSSANRDTSKQTTNDERRTTARTIQAEALLPNTRRTRNLSPAPLSLPPPPTAAVLRARDPALARAPPRALPCRRDPKEQQKAPPRRGGKTALRIFQTSLPPSTHHRQQRETKPQQPWPPPTQPSSRPSCRWPRA